MGVLVAFIALQIFDAAFTYWGIRAGFLVEMNPVLVLSFDRFGVLPSLLVSKLLASVFGIGLYRFRERDAFGIGTMAFLKLFTWMMFILGIWHGVQYIRYLVNG